MKILILGVGKSGTTALLYKIGAARPEFKIFSGGKLGKAANVQGDAIFKFTISDHKNRSFENLREHLLQTQYDRKIWIARDPRDNAISRALFEWYQGSRINRDQYHAVIKLAEKKERAPRAVAFCEFLRYRSQLSQPLSIVEAIALERMNIEKTYDFVSRLGKDWFIFKYEDLVVGNFTKLHEFLGFEIKPGANVDNHTKKVARKKSAGDWRHWYTEADVDWVRPFYTPYMDLIGYDSDDWNLDVDQLIEPEYASMYLRKLPNIRRRESFAKFKKKISRFFTKR